jgi:hypothetical protein
MPSTPYQTTDVVDTTIAPNPTMGISATDPVGFFGSAGSVQLSGPNQAATPLSGGLGNAVQYSLTEGVVSAVTLNTALEKTLALTSPGPLATDFLLPMCKLTTQAGLAVLSGRVAGANSIGMSYGNNTGSSITPASEVCQFATVSAPLTLTAALTPAAVPASSVVEQIFTVVGVFPSQAVFVNKPTQQTGLGIANARVVANNQVAIQFVNFTAAPITPTAGETYSFFATNGISVIEPLLEVGVPAITTSITTVTSTENTLPCAQILADDMILGVSKPSLNAGIVTGSARATAGNILQQYVNPTAGGVSPTAEVMSYEVVRHNQLAPVVITTAPLIPISVAANTSAEQTFTVAGLISGGYVAINKPTLTPGLIVAGCRVSGTNTLAINFMNLTGAAIVPPAEVYTVLYNPNAALTAGTWIKQFIGQWQVLAQNLLTSVRNALVTTGFIPGA